MFRPATPLSVILFIAFVLLLLSSLSTPIIKGIPLGNVDGYNFGVWGYCSPDNCSSISLGYDTHELNLAGDSNFSLPSSTRHSLSSILVVHPIAAFLTLICFILAIAAHFHSPAHSSRYLFALLILTLPTLLVSLLAFLIDILIFIPHVSWGGWIVLGATILICMSTVVACAMRRTLVSRKARKRRIAENAEMNGENYYTARQQVLPASIPALDSSPTHMIMDDDMSSSPPDKLPQFAAYDLSKKQSQEDKTPLNPGDHHSMDSSNPSAGYGSNNYPSQDDVSDRYGNVSDPGRTSPNASAQPSHSYEPLMEGFRSESTSPPQQYMPPPGSAVPMGPGYGNPQSQGPSPMPHQQPLRPENPNGASYPPNRPNGPYPPPFYGRGRGGPPPMRGGYGPPPRGGYMRGPPPHMMQGRNGYGNPPPGYNNNGGYGRGGMMYPGGPMPPRGMPDPSIGHSPDRVPRGYTSSAPPPPGYDRRYGPGSSPGRDYDNSGPGGMNRQRSSPGPLAMGHSIMPPMSVPPEGTKGMGQSYEMDDRSRRYQAMPPPPPHTASTVSSNSNAAANNNNSGIPNVPSSTPSPLSGYRGPRPLEDQRQPMEDRNMNRSPASYSNGPYSQSRQQTPSTPGGGNSNIGFVNQEYESAQGRVLSPIEASPTSGRNSLQATATATSVSASNQRQSGMDYYEDVEPRFAESRELGPAVSNSSRPTSTTMYNVPEMREEEHNNEMNNNYGSNNAYTTSAMDDELHLPNNNNNRMQLPPSLDPTLREY